MGREANRKKMEKHFAIEVSDDALSWARKQERIEAEARLDGIYIVRTSLPADALGAEAAVAAYKSLARAAVYTQVTLDASSDRACYPR